MGGGGAMFFSDKIPMSLKKNYKHTCNKDDSIECNEQSTLDC